MTETTRLIESLYDFTEDGSREKYLRKFSTSTLQSMVDHHARGNIYLHDREFLHELSGRLGLVFRDDGFVGFIKSWAVNELLLDIYRNDKPLVKDDLIHLPCESELEEYIEAYNSKHPTFTITDPKKAAMVVGRCWCCIIPHIGVLSINGRNDIDEIYTIIDSCGRWTKYKQMMVRIIKTVARSRYVDIHDAAKLLSELEREEDKNFVIRELGRQRR